jgi:hypothetical protein
MSTSMKRMTPTTHDNALQGPLGLGLLVIAGIVLIVSLGFAFAQLMASGHTSLQYQFQPALGAAHRHLPLLRPGLLGAGPDRLAAAGVRLQAVLPGGQALHLPGLHRADLGDERAGAGARQRLPHAVGHPAQPAGAVGDVLDGRLLRPDLLFLLWKFSKLQGGEWDSKTAKQVGIASFIGVLLASGNLALIFGMMSMRPFWFDALLPIYFYFTGVTSGVAALVFFTYLAHGFQRERMPQALQGCSPGPCPSCSRR